MTNPSEAPGQGVIHDIGYRHYAGTRLGRRQIVRALYVDSLRGAFGLGRSARSKIIPMGLFAMMCLPAVIMVIIAAVTKAHKLPGGYDSYTFNAHTLTAVFLAAQAPVVVSKDLRFRVMSLYLSRPLSRDDYVLAKLGAFATAVFILIGSPLLILFVGALLARLPLGAQAREFFPALGGAVLFSLVLAGVALVIAAVTPRRGFGVAAIITILLLSSTISGIAQGIASDQGSFTLAGYLGLLSPVAMVQGVQTWLLHTGSPLPAEPPGTVGGLVFTAATLGVIAGCYGLLLLRYRKVSVS